MEISVSRGDWGGGQPLDIEALLRNVASHLECYLRKPIEETIIVLPTASTEDIPMTCYRSSPEAPIVILLQARNAYWCQFSYQFAHELCHVLSCYERLKDNPNGWFHETLCELAAVFVLRRMAGSWLISPPYPNRGDYAQSISSYADDLLSHPEKRLPQETTLRTWLESQEESLRGDPYQRAKNAIVAYSLLALFESVPSGWNAVRNLPESSIPLAGYLLEWHSRVDLEDQPFVQSIIQEIYR